jgi:hypothetical protein
MLPTLTRCDLQTVSLAETLDKWLFNSLFARLLDHFSSCPTIEKYNKYHRLFTYIGQFPIQDGLFGRPCLAYFSGLQIELTSVCRSGVRVAHDRGYAPRA